MKKIIKNIIKKCMNDVLIGEIILLIFKNLPATVAILILWILESIVISINPEHFWCVSMLAMFFGLLFIVLFYYTWDCPDSYQPGNRLEKYGKSIYDRLVKYRFDV